MRTLSMLNAGLYSLLRPDSRVIPAVAAGRGGSRSPGLAPSKSGGVTATHVPLPAELSILRLPPAASTRSCNPTSPEPSPGSAPPTPSSRTISVRVPSSVDTSMRSLVALAAASLGHVAANRVDHAPLADGRRGPLDPFVRAVLAQHSVLERTNRRTCEHASCLLLAALAAVRMDELHEGPRTPVALGVPEQRLHRRIHPLPVTDEP
jgi:hypothetical protein